MMGDEINRLRFDLGCPRCGSPIENYYPEILPDADYQTKEQE
jgi:hypothetical protein